VPSRTDPPKQIPVRRKLGYALGIHGIMYFWYATNLYLFYFFTDVIGLTPAQAGQVFLISLVWDGITDPVMGVVTDRMVARGIRYRKLMLGGGLPFCASFVLLFRVPDLMTPFAYCLLTNLAFRTFWTMTYIPYTSMLTRITGDSIERARIGGFKTVFIGLAKLPVAYLVLPLVGLIGAGDEARGFFWTMSGLALMGALAFIGCAWLSPRERRLESGSAPNPGLSAVRDNLKRNSQFWIILAGLFFASGSFGILMQSIIYVFKYVLVRPEDAKLAFTAIAVAGLTAVPVWMWVVARTGNRFVWLSGCLFGVAALGTLYASPAPGTWVVTALVFLAASGIYGFLMPFLPMVADCVDFGELKSGIRVEALTFGLMSLANKLSIGCAGWLLGVLQTRVGLEPNETQTEATQAGLMAIMTLTPAAGLAVSAAFISLYRLSPARHRQVVEALAERRG